MDKIGASVEHELNRLHHWDMQTCRHYAVGVWGKWVLYTKADGWRPVADDVPGLRQLIETTCDMDALEVSHVFYSERDGYLHPHRDWPEEAALFRRIHIPIQADQGCFMSEGSSLFRMEAGEAWLLEASEVHSAGCFSERPRFHLALDLSPGADLGTALTIAPSSHPTCSTISQPVWTVEQEDAFLGLAPLLSPTSLERIVALASALHFDWDLHAEGSWQLLAKLADSSGDAVLIDMVHKTASRFLCHSG